MEGAMPLIKPRTRGKQLVKHRIREAAIKMNRGAKVRQTTAQRSAQSD
jgi:hypothetical protein